MVPISLLISVWVRCFCQKVMIKSDVVTSNALRRGFGGGRVGGWVGTIGPRFTAVMITDGYSNDVGSCLLTSHNWTPKENTPAVLSSGMPRQMGPSNIE